MRLFSILLLAATALSARKETGFLNRSVKVEGATYLYQVYVPPDWSKDKKWPVILFLHGAGERGEDGLAQTDVGIGRAIRMNVARWLAIVVFPQCRRNEWWSRGRTMEAQALAALAAAMKEFRGDPRRVYLTGLSMGGYGSWAFASRNPGKFAALVVICGGVRLPERLRTTGESEVADPYTDVARKIGKIPVWIFHGDADNIVPIDESRKMNEALKTAGVDVRLTEYEKVGHNSWDRAYGDPELSKWLFSHKLP